MSHGQRLTIHGRDHRPGGVDPIKTGEWHVVGATGEPAFQNGWTNVASYGSTRFRLVAGGAGSTSVTEPNQHLEIEMCVTSGTAGTTIFTLPSGFYDWTGGQVILRSAIDPSSNQYRVYKIDGATGNVIDVGLHGASGAGGTGGVTFDITQSAHGFAVGDVVRYNPDNVFGAVTYVASAQSDNGATQQNTISATIPAGLAAGDILILKVEFKNNFASTDNSSSAPGFTRLGPSPLREDLVYLDVLYRVLDGSESYITSGGSVTVTIAGTDSTHNNIACFAIAYRGCSTTSPFDTVVQTGSSSATNNGYSTTYTTAGAREVLLEFVQTQVATTATFSAPGGGTKRQDTVLGVGGHSYVYESPEIALPGPQSVTTSWTNSEYEALLVALRPHGAGNVYVKAQADNATDAEVIGIVTAVADTDHFTLTLNGHVSGLSGLTVGSVYFLSPTTAGAMTKTEPSATGQVSKPLLVADSASTGFFFNQRGKLIGSAADSGSSFGVGGAAGLTKLFDSTLAADAASIDTGAAAIPTGYSGIEIHIIAKSSGAAATNINVQFNGDTGGNYDREYIESNGSSIITGTNTAATSAQVGSTTVASATYPGLTVIIIPAYADTTFNEALYALLAAFSTMDVRCGGWRSTAAINQVKIAPSDGSNFKAGSRMVIYARA